MPAANPITVYSANLILPVISAPIWDGAVAVSDGAVLFVGARSAVLSQLREEGLPFREEHFYGIMAPGLVNAHTHLQYTGMREVGSRDYDNFHAWALAFNEVYNPIKARGENPWRAWAEEGAALLIGSGTTAAADVVTDPEAASVLRDAGLHGISYWELMNLTAEDWNEQEIAQAVAACGAGICAHAPYSLNEMPLREIPKLARRFGCRLHIHLAESPIESEYNESVGACINWHHYRADDFTRMRLAGNGESAVSYVDRLGLLGPDCHIAHGIYVNARDREILRKRGVSVCLCPRSNRIAGLDPSPVAAYLTEGNALCVGTDSLSSNRSLDLMEDVRELALLARAQGYDKPDLYERLFFAATMGGAQALGQGTPHTSSRTGSLGQISEGASADFAVFDLPIPKRREHISAGCAGVNAASSKPHTDKRATIHSSAPADAYAALVENGAGNCICTVIAGEIRRK